jgi:hypothetical protein
MVNVERLGRLLDEARAVDDEVDLRRHCHRHRVSQPASRQAAQPRQQLLAVAVGQAQVQQQEHGLQHGRHSHRLCSIVGHMQDQVRAPLQHCPHDDRIDGVVLHVEHVEAPVGLCTSQAIESS